MTTPVAPNAAQLTNLAQQNAVNLRNVCQSILSLFNYANQIGLSGLETAGFSSGQAATFLNQVDLAATVAQVYYGTVQSQGSGGTGAILYDFNTALLPSSGPY